MKPGNLKRNQFRNRVIFKLRFFWKWPLIMEELLEAIERHGKDLFQMITELLEKFSDQLRSSENVKLESLRCFYD